MNLIDSHCHLSSFRSKGELETTLTRAKARGVNRYITVGTSPKDWGLGLEMKVANPGIIDYTAGLHPCYVDTEWRDAVSGLNTFFMSPHPPVALGEIGLDYFRLPGQQTNLSGDTAEANNCRLHQQAAFRQQLSLAHKLDLPVIIHSRNAFDDTFRLIDESGINWSRIVFHCFSYSPEVIAKINERGGRGSFTGIVTYKNASDIREALHRQGIKRLMLETDCPYLTPEPHRGHPNEPAYLADIADHCAKILALPLQELAEQTTVNVKAFFQLP